MKFDFAAVDTQGLTLQSIITRMEENLQHIQSLKVQLLQEFAGAGATGYQAVSDTLGRQLNEYNATVQSLKNVIATVAGTDGTVRATDVNSGNRFYSI